MHCHIKFEEGIQITFDDIKSFNRYNEDRETRNVPDHPIRGFVKSIKCEVVYIDEYGSGMYEWYVLGGKFLNMLEPLCFHSLEDYIEM